MLAGKLSPSPLLVVVALHKLIFLVLSTTAMSAEPSVPPQIESCKHKLYTFVKHFSHRDNFFSFPPLPILFISDPRRSEEAHNCSLAMLRDCYPVAILRKKNWLAGIAVLVAPWSVYYVRKQCFARKLVKMSTSKVYVKHVC